MSAALDAVKNFSLVFLPLFVAMAALSLTPFVMALLGQVQPERRSRVISTALLTGLAIGLVFLGLGRGIFFVLGISVSDFLIAGGIVLLAVALKDLLTTTAEPPKAMQELIAVVPIGTPLLVGPATVSMLILLSGLFSFWLIVLAFVANLLIAWVIFSQSRRILGFLGEGGIQAFSKVSYLLLAAIAVQLIRKGLAGIIQLG